MLQTSRTATARALKGFTLIETLVVLSMIMLLVGLVAPSQFARIQQSKEVVLEQNLQSLRSAIDKFYADKGRYPRALPELVEARYLNRLPVDPVTGSDTTWIERQPEPGETDVEGVANVKSGAEGKSTKGISYVDF